MVNQTGSFVRPNIMQTYRDSSSKSAWKYTSSSQGWIVDHNAPEREVLLQHMHGAGCESLVRLYNSKPRHLERAGYCPDYNAQTGHVRGIAASGLYSKYNSQVAAVNPGELTCSRWIAVFKPAGKRDSYDFPRVSSHAANYLRDTFQPKMHFCTETYNVDARS